MTKQYLCNNCNKPMHNSIVNGMFSRLFFCHDCGFVLAILDGQIESISIELSFDLSFRSGKFHNDAYAYFISNGNVVEVANILILPNITDDIIEVKEYIERIKGLIVLL